MNTKTLARNGFYRHLINFYFKAICFFNKLRIAVFFAIIASGLLANNLSFQFSCTDLEKPVIAINTGSCEIAIKNLKDQLCYAHLSLKATATDNETPQQLLLFDYTIDINNDGMGKYAGGYDYRSGPLTMEDFNAGGKPAIHDNPYADNENNPFDASGTYPIGIHKICWYVSDSCGNKAASCRLFEIKDCKAPTPYCLTGVITVPLPASRSLTILAKDLDKGSFDNCTIADSLKFYFNGDRSATSITITCQDFVAAGATDELIVDVQMWVEDEEGNADYCKTGIIVQDNQSLCGDNHPGSISGRVFSIRNRKDTIPCKNVKIGQVDAGGYYHLNLNKGEYKLCSKKFDEYYDSVSTYDMILIQKYILGISTFTNSYQQYAADVNQSGSITGADVSEIRKLVLREIDSFKRGSWFVFPIILPYTANCIDVKLGNFEERKIDFRGIKIGDVNNLISSETDKLLIPNPNDSLRFNIVNKHFKAGDTVRADFYSQNFSNIFGYQYTIKFDTQYLKFIDFIKNSLVTSNKSNFGTRYVDSGFITTSSFNPFPSYDTYKPDEELFTIQFIARNNGSLCDLISITGDLTPAEAYRDSFLLNNISLDVCDELIKTNEAKKDFIRVYPNPFENEIHFQFSEEVQFPLQIQMYSLEGKLITARQLTNRQKTWTWVDTKMKQGVYFIRIRDGKNVIGLKMVKE